jgi:hypothetical protein
VYLAPDTRLSWLVALLPFLEEEPLWSRTDTEESWESERNRHLVESRLKLLTCPATPQNAAAQGFGITTYIGMAGVGPDAPMLPVDDKRAGLFGYDRIVRLQDIKDGTANTIMVIETATALGPWAAGGPATVRGFDPDKRPYLAVDGQFGLKHKTDTFFRSNPVGSNIGRADGSVKYFTAEIRSQTLEALATIAGGDKPGDDY